MAVSHLSLLDLVGQNTSSSTSTAAAETGASWLHFQDLLKTALDRNAAADPATVSLPERAVTRTASVTADSTSTAKTEARKPTAAHAPEATATKAQAEKPKPAPAARHGSKGSQSATAQDARPTAPTVPDTASASSDPAVAAATVPTATAAPQESAPASAEDAQTATGAKVDGASTPVPDPAVASPDATAAAAATVVAALLPVAPSSETPQPATDPGPQGSATLDPVATTGLADLLASTSGSVLGDHSPAGATAPGLRGAKSGDPQSADSASALFAGGGDAASALAAGLSVAPASRGGGQSSGQSSGRSQSDSRPSQSPDRSQDGGAADPQAVPVAQTLASPPVLPQPPVAAAAVLGLSTAGTGAARSAAPATEDTVGDPTGTTTGLGLGAPSSTVGLAPFRPSETANAASPYAATQVPLPVEQVALAIGRLTNGARSFSMQLNPEHLGSVDVRMEVDAKGKTKVAITAERPETLALLKLDSHHLVKALQDSGVSADPSSLSFSLREQGSNPGGDRRSGSGQNGGASRTGPDDTQDSEVVPVKMALSRHLYDIHA